MVERNDVPEMINRACVESDGDSYLFYGVDDVASFLRVSFISPRLRFNALEVHDDQLEPAQRWGNIGRAYKVNSLYFLKRNAQNIGFG